MKIYNSLTRKIEDFVPNEPGKVSMYTCGPTVYHYAHIGNLRSYICEDVLEKILRFSGFNVKRVMNITDVGHLASDADTGEDKMLKGAKREHKSVMEIAGFYTDAFFSDCAKLNIKTPDVVAPATNCIPEFINMIEGLLEKGYAYKAGDKDAIVYIPDLVLLDVDETEVITVEGKKYINRQKGIEELNNYDSFDNMYLKKYYPKFKIVRT